MSEMIRRPQGDMVIHGPPGSRPVGIRVKPALRLAIGYRDEAKRGAPTKVDYFIPKQGAQGEYNRAAAKFTEVYGDKPKSIDIRLPSEFGQALDIRYKAFAGAEGDEGGVMIAKGDTNFALYDWVGGPDILTVWHHDGTVEEIETLGIDAITGKPLDSVAASLDLALYTTFRFGIPSVLGFGSFCEITSKGKETTDTLWLKLRGWYTTFQSRTSWVVRPTLFVKPSTARPMIKTKEGETKRIKTRIYVLDLVLSEPEEDLLARLREHAQLTSLAAGDLWQNGGALPPESEVIDEDEPITQGSIQQDEPTVFPPTVGSSSAGEPVIVTTEKLELTGEEVARLPIASQRKPPFGSYQTYGLERILSFGEAGRDWLAYALRQDYPQDSSFVTDLQLFCKANIPEVYTEWIGEQT